MDAFQLTQEAEHHLNVLLREMHRTKAPPTACATALCRSVLMSGDAAYVCDDIAHMYDSANSLERVRQCRAELAVASWLARFAPRQEHWDLKPLDEYQNGVYRSLLGCVSQ